MDHLCHIAQILPPRHQRHFRILGSIPKIQSFPYIQVRTLEIPPKNQVKIRTKCSGLKCGPGFMPARCIGSE